MLGTTINKNSDYPAVYGQSFASTGHGVGVERDGYITGVSGSSSGGYGVMGVDGAAGTGISGASFSGTGVYGSSFAGTAAYFEGNATVTEALTVASLMYASDKNLKTAVHEIDATDLVRRLTELPITSWNYKRDPLKRHVGPMAQDFHAAFGLDGDDDTHISEVDIAGVSLAAIQALNNQTAALKTQIAAQAKAMADMQQAFSERMAALERRETTVGRL